MAGASNGPGALTAAQAVAACRHAEAEGDPARARRWLERARRIAPDDAMVALSLALSCFANGDAKQAQALFTEVTSRFDVGEAWLGLAASALRAGDREQAAGAMQACLSRHAASATALQLAAAIGGETGWCAIDERGRLHATGADLLELDGVPLAPRWRGGTMPLPPGRWLAASRAGAALLGSPVDRDAIGATEGFVEAADGFLSGWAWHPNDPVRDPVVTIIGETRLQLTLRVLREAAEGPRPLTRPRVFSLAIDRLPAGALRVCGPDGRDLLGSPIDPGLEWRSAAGIEDRFRPIWADMTGPARSEPPRDRPVDVVVPVYGGRAQALACIAQVLATLPKDSRLHVVDDCSPDMVLVAALEGWAEEGRINLVRQPRNRGFPAAANAGMQAAAGRDMVLLNSDTLVPPGWLDVLVAAARSAPGIGTVCPLSNEATILSYPARDGGNPMPDQAGTVALHALAARANGGAVIDVPVAVGSCMFISRDCLDGVGSFREDLFAQGYGEENDFCLRARHLGWRNVAATGGFVAHEGGASFGLGRRHLQARNGRVLGRLHPGYDAMVAAWIERDPLGPARMRIDALRFRAGRRAASVVLVTHGGGGGVERVVSARAQAAGVAGRRAIVLRPDGDCVVVGDGDTPNLRYAMPDGLRALAQLLRPERPAHVELHHMLGHDPALLGLAAMLGVPHEVHVHDYAWFCPRIALVPEHSYCGEPDIAGCEACVADHGSNLAETIGVAPLVARSAAVLGDARRVVAPAADVAARLQRHFPRVRYEVEPLDDDGAITQPPIPRHIRRVCVVGGIGVEKGYEVLLGCVRDAARRRLNLHFTLVGHSMDDERLMAAGPIEITGRYDDDEVVALVAAQRADVAFLPSVWPETWCFTLGHVWRAGLRAVVFDLGAPAERVRRTGWGWVLPYGLAARGVNDWMTQFDAGQQRSRRAGNFPQPHSDFASKR